MVTLDGQLINAGGSMTGGSAAKNVGALSRANELARLKIRLSELEKTLEKLAGDRSSAEKEVAAVSFDAETAEGRKRSAEDACLKLEGELGQRLALTEALRQNLESSEKSARAGKEEEKNLQEADKTAEAESRQHRASAAALQEEAAALAGDRKDLAEKLEELRSGASRLQAEEASLRSEIAGARQGIEEWQQLLAGFTGDRESREALKRRLAEQNESIRREMEALGEKADAEKAETEKLKPRLNETMLLRQDYEGRRSRAEKASQEANRRINELERQFAQLEQRKNTADMEEKQLLDKLWDNYELSRSAAQRQRQPLDNLSQAQKRASLIRREMNAMGSPNLGAIEEFERVNERYTFLTSQRDDIEKARAELLQVVSELTGEMEKIFRVEFEAVASSFSETFTELFGGGRGELILEDPEDILNCGIEIRVQPPGKALKTLTLLSGGERAFVAIALYFSMLKVRPAPFCVLDEIESALDENNVARFANYMRRMAENTQFLVITHRRGTMEASDMLYGVTMQKGISRVISVSLEDAVKGS